jgi:hypothetical protein
MPGADEFKNKIIFKKKINNLKLGYVSHSPAATVRKNVKLRAKKSKLGGLRILIDHENS